MSTRIADHLRGNLVGYVAVFIALSGTAYAIDGPLAGQNTVGSGDIINGEVYSSDLRNNQVTSADVRDDALVTGGLSSSDIFGLGGGDISDGSLGGADVQNQSLTGSDIQDNTVNADDVFGLRGDDDIENSSLTGVDVTNESLTGADIANNALTGTDIRPGSLGHTDLDIYSREATAAVAGGSPENGAYITNGASASCDSGDIAIAGGARWNPLRADDELMLMASWGVGSQWSAWGGNDSGVDNTLVVTATCLDP